MTSPPDPSDTFAAALRGHRQRAGLTQERLAELAKLSVNAVSALERGERRRPYPHTINSLAGALGLTGEEHSALCGLARSQPAAASTSTAASHRPLPVPRQVPAAVRGFTGRKADLARLDRLLPTSRMASAVVISAIGGTAGVGKTALAVTWAHRVRSHFPDGQLYVNLRGYDSGPPVPPEEALEGFLRALDVPVDQIPPKLEQRAALFRSVLDGRRMLLLLDNANHPDQVRPLLPGSPSSMAVITSRSSLTGLAVSAGATLLDLDLLPLDEALALLRACLDPTRVAADPAAVVELAHLCARLPLALRLCGQHAASRPHRPLAELAAELRDANRRLELLSRGCDESTAIRTVFTWSYQGLSEPQARMFRLLGLHPGPSIDHYAAAALAGLPSAGGRGLLDDLADAHLVEAGASDRYHMHDLLRVYARERVARHEDPDASAALVRLIDHYLQTVVAAARVLNPNRSLPFPEPTTASDPYPTFAEYDEALEWCEREHLAVVELARAATAAGHHRSAWQLTHALGGYYFLRTNWTVWLDAYQIGLTAARAAGDRPGEGHMLNALAIGFAAVRREREAIAALDEALILFRELGDQLGEARTQINLGDTLLRVHRYQDVITHCERALEIYRRASNPYLESLALGTQAEAYLALGMHDQAITIFHDVMLLCRKANYRSGEGLTHAHLGEAYLRSGREAEAGEHLAAAVDLCEESGDRYGGALALRRLGELHKLAGNLPAARDYWRSAMAVFEELRDPRAEELRDLLMT
jgi:tetratricopeptide (TPR) repeat protein/transcriptional regulator with XRE-family HTH domain